MKPLLLLVSVFAISVLAHKIFTGNFEFAVSGRIALSVMLLFTALGHFLFTKGMSMMLPGFVPFKTAIIYVTGVMEIMAAIALFIPKFRVVTAWFLIVFFILLLPSNVYAAVKHIDYQQGTFDGNGPAYLWFRVPLQVLFIVWTYLSAIR